MLESYLYHFEFKRLRMTSTVAALENKIINNGGKGYDFFGCKRLMVLVTR